MSHELPRLKTKIAEIQASRMGYAFDAQATNWEYEIALKEQKRGDVDYLKKSPALEILRQAGRMLEEVFPGDVVLSATHPDMAPLGYPASLRLTWEHSDNTDQNEVAWNEISAKVARNVEGTILGIQINDNSYIDQSDVRHLIEEVDSSAVTPKIVHREKKGDRALDEPRATLYRESIDLIDHTRYVDTKMTTRGERIGLVKVEGEEEYWEVIPKSVILKLLPPKFYIDVPDSPIPFDDPRIRRY